MRDATAMMVEFIGSTGSGKSTLVRETRRWLAGSEAAVEASELLARRLGLGWVTHPTARNLIADLSALPLFLRALPRRREYLSFVLRALARQGRPGLQTLNYLRSVARKLGVHEIVARRAPDRIVLVDEGTLLTAHLLFVYSEAVFDPEQVAHFAKLVPLPDRVVYVRAPVPTLVQRTLARPDPPRELRGREGAPIAPLLERASRVFEQLVATPELRNRVLVVDNAGESQSEREALAQRIGAFILEGQRERASGTASMQARPVATNGAP